jgi:hypothetical protein
MPTGDQKYITSGSSPNVSRTESESTLARSTANNGLQTHSEQPLESQHAIRDYDFKGIPIIIPGTVVHFAASAFFW